MARLVFDRDRRAFLLTRALVRTMLSRYARVRAGGLAFIANVHGRPGDSRSAARRARPALQHLAHRRPDRLRGDDRPRGRRRRRAHRPPSRRTTSPGRFFAPREVSDLQRLPDDEQQRVFFDYWTLKEAYIKARGFGLALPLGDFAFKLNPPRPPRDHLRAVARRRSGDVAVLAGLADAAASPRPRGAARRRGPAGPHSRRHPVMSLSRRSSMSEVGMKLWAISDLHVGYDENRRAVQALPRIRTTG